MKRTLEELFPILEVREGCMISTHGDFTVGLEIMKSEIFSAGKEAMMKIADSWLKCVSMLPAGSVLHMQDIYIEDVVMVGPNGKNRSFLQEASDRFFGGRRFLDHSCYLYLTKRPAGRRLNGPGASSLLSRTILPRETLNKASVSDFMRMVGQFEQLLMDSGLIAVRRLTDDEILGEDGHPGLIEQYCQLSFMASAPTINDISLTPTVRIGDKECILYSLGDAADLPVQCSPFVAYGPYSSEHHTMPVGFSDPLGPLLPCSHIYNQYLFIEDPYPIVQKLELKRRRLHSLSLHSRENNQVRDSVDEFLNAVTGEQKRMVKAHFNVLSWGTNAEELDRNKKLLASAISRIGATPHLETVSAPQIWFAGIPGNSADLPSSELFDILAEQAVCFLMGETNYRNSG